MTATHQEVRSGHRLEMLEIRSNGVGVFQDLDRGNARLVCPITPDFVIGYIETSTAKEIPYHDPRIYFGSRSQRISLFDAYRAVAWEGMKATLSGGA